MSKCREKNNLPDDVKLAFHEGVELYQCIMNYEQDVITKDQFIRDMRNIKQQQSPEPEQQPDEYCDACSRKKESGETYCPCYNGESYILKPEQPPSESEREKIYKAINVAIQEIRLSGSGAVINNITDFILERDKEKDAEIERLKNTIHLTYKGSCGRDYMHLPLNEAVGKITSDLRAENERLKGERKEWIDVKTKKPSLNRVGNEFLVAVKMASRYEYQIAEWFDMRDGETEPFFQIEYSWCGQQMTNKYVTHWAELIDFPSE